MPPAMDLNTVIVQNTERKRSGTDLKTIEEKTKITKMNNQTQEIGIPLSNRYLLFNDDDDMETGNDAKQTPTDLQQAASPTNSTTKKVRKLLPIVIHGKVNSHSKIIEMIKCLVVQKILY